MAVHTERKTLQLRNIAERLEIDELQRGNRAVPFRTGGYVGFRTGRVAYGERENAAIVQLSGDLARQEWGAVYPLHDSLTRLDLAVTTRYPGACDAVPSQAYEQAALYHDTHPKSALPVLVKDAHGGGTCMVGKRGSDFHLRFYHKEAECRSRNDLEGAEHYHNCMRAELECTDAAASAVAKAYNEQTDRPAFVQQFLYDYITAHGINCPFPRPALRPLSRDSVAGRIMRRGYVGCTRACGLRLLGCERMVESGICSPLWG